MITRFFASLLLAAFVVSAAAAQTVMPLPELLRSTHIHGLAVHPQNASLLIATHHGLFVLDDAGRARQLSQRRDDFMGFSPHPTDGSVLFASGHPATGGNLGFIRSNDGGRTWQQLSAGVNGPVDFHQLAVSRADPQTIWGIHGGLQVSRDGGRTWSMVGDGPEQPIALAASSRDANTLYAGTQKGLLRSKDGGKTWEPAYILRRPTTMVEMTADGQIYAFIVGTGLVRASEAALDWEIVSNGFGAGYVLHLAIDPSNPQKLYAATHKGELLASTDGGRTWSPLSA